jgi:hypothetical protein
MYEESESYTATSRRPFQHLHVAIGVAERRDGAAADELMDSHRLACFVVHELNLS